MCVPPELKGGWRSGLWHVPAAVLAHQLVLSKQAGQADQQQRLLAIAYMMLLPAAENGEFSSPAIQQPKLLKTCLAAAGRPAARSHGWTIELYFTRAPP